MRIAALVTARDREKTSPCGKIEGNNAHLQTNLGGSQGPNVVVRLGSNPDSRPCLAPEFDRPGPGMWLAARCSNLLDIFSRTTPSQAPRKVYRDSCSHDTLSGQIFFFPNSPSRPDHLEPLTKGGIWHRSHSRDEKLSIPSHRGRRS